jgi:hypothetical protein
MVFKTEFLHANQTPHWKKYHGIIPRGPRPNVHKGNFTYKSLYKGETTKGKYKTYVSLTPPFKLKVDQPYWVWKEENNVDLECGPW